MITRSEVCQNLTLTESDIFLNEPPKNVCNRLRCGFDPKTSNACIGHRLVATVQYRPNRDFVIERQCNWLTAQLADCAFSRPN